jgi:hypothetical protein
MFNMNNSPDSRCNIGYHHVHSADHVVSECSIHPFVVVEYSHLVEDWAAKAAYYFPVR